MLSDCPEDLHQPVRQTRLVKALLDVNDRIHELKAASEDANFEKWQATWKQQNDQIQNQLHWIENQLGTQQSPIFGVVGLVNDAPDNVNSQ